MNTERCTCPEGLVFVDAGSPCGDTCADLKKPCNVATYVPVKGCYCPKGYLRLRNGKCVPIDSDECRIEYNRCTAENTSGVIPANCTSTRTSFKKQITRYSPSTRLKNVDFFPSSKQHRVIAD